ncbi:homocysteine S-methyltransferase family protein [Rubinisphaera margarita]|uniref:homocysteine S-methyltransferase family protein n=1 Tax=Rubinisphaera margarita TaxID=2909586 RepID=UPI001EE8A24A|nr:homocysteine S-methyltransferase family protein [Rubinisphaera margarita]MCG6157151.1 homocysteine S-methyltransferase family protein [Rubinisphaera margarita]
MVETSKSTVPSLFSSPDQVLILDGPMGTELTKRGFDVGRPGWSARALLEAPELISAIHRDYVEAGAMILTTNTFRTHAVNLEGWHDPAEAGRLTRLAVELAREAAGHRCRVFGSVSPLGDSYLPGEAVEPSWLQEQHTAMLNELLEAGVDGLLVETQTTFREAEMIVHLTRGCGRPVVLSVVSFDGQTMLDGTPLACLRELARSGLLDAIGCNCVPVEIVEDVLHQMQDFGIPKVVYANSGRMNSLGEWEESAGALLDQHVAFARIWTTHGVRLLGGCCGTDVDLVANFADEFADSF